MRTRMWQISNEIVKLAKRLDANIAIERLRRLRKRKGEWNKKSTRKANRIPYGFFRHVLTHVAEREGVIVKPIKPNYTSQTCPRCRYVGRENWKGYSYFRCVKCGYEADRDRVASLNIAQRATHAADQAEGQIPQGNASVSRRAWKDEGCGRSHHTTQSFKPTALAVGY